MALLPFWYVDTGGIHRGHTGMVDPNGPIPAGSFDEPPATTGTEVAQWTLANVWVVLPTDPASTEPDYFTALGCAAVIQALYAQIARLHDQMVRPTEEPLYAEKVRQAQAYVDPGFTGDIPKLIEAIIPAGTAPEDMETVALNRANYIIGKWDTRTDVMGELELARKDVAALALESPGNDFRTTALGIEETLNGQSQRILGSLTYGSSGVWP